MSAGDLEDLSLVVMSPKVEGISLFQLVDGDAIVIYLFPREPIGILYCGYWTAPAYGE